MTAREWAPGDPIWHRPDPYLSEGFPRRIFDIIEDHDEGICSLCRTGVPTGDAMVIKHTEGRNAYKEGDA